MGHRVADPPAGAEARFVDPAVVPEQPALPDHRVAAQDLRRAPRPAPVSSPRATSTQDPSSSSRRSTARRESMAGGTRASLKTRARRRRSRRGRRPGWRAAGRRRRRPTRVPSAPSTANRSIVPSVDGCGVDDLEEPPPVGPTAGRTPRRPTCRPRRRRRRRRPLRIGLEHRHAAEHLAGRRSTHAGPDLTGRRRTCGRCRATRTARRRRCRPAPRCLPGRRRSPLPFTITAVPVGSSSAIGAGHAGGEERRRPRR